MTKRSKRRTHSAQFKFRVALEAAKGEQSINEIAAKQKVLPNQVSAWKSELLYQGVRLFERKNSANRERE